MSELPRCPFCKGEDIFTNVFDYSGDRISYGAQTICMSCGARVESNNGNVVRHSSPEKAIEAAERHWMMCAERTCDVKSRICDTETGELEYFCPVCEYVADPVDWAESWNYCPNCGAKVVKK